MYKILYHSCCLLCALLYWLGVLVMVGDFVIVIQSISGLKWPIFSAS